MNRQQSNPPQKPITDDEVDQHIRDFFECNYDLLRQEGGHALAEGSKQQALEQSLLYWRKLKTLAISVTETEVKLALPGQATPKGRPFVIEGVVDIVREGDDVRMYDLKTHEEREVRAQRSLYEDQLNVYAHIWKGIRRQRLDGTAIIATRLPADLRDALRSGNPAAIKAAIDVWQPVVELPFDDNDIGRTIEDFGRCVDAIENGEFNPPPSRALGQAAGTRRSKDHGALDAATSTPAPTFAQIHCQNCDGRSSCASYQAYQRTPSARPKQVSASTKDDFDEERALDEWIETNLGDDA